MSNSIDLRKTRTNTTSSSISSINLVQHREPRAQRQIKIPYYHVVNGVVCTNFHDAVEYKRELR